MKKITLLFVLIATLGCSSENSSDDSKKNIPEKFDIKIEIKSISGSSPKTSIFVNSVAVKQWTNLTFPFEGAYTYYTKGDEISNNACKCITISAWAYLSKIDNIESFNLYINGKLVDSTKVTASSEPNGIMNPTILEFVYTP
jgi:hypothetical protein